MQSQPPASPDPLILQPGTIVDKNWTVRRLLSSGGIGDIYEVEDNFLKVLRALKYLRAEHADIQELKARLKREARFGAQIEHPNLNHVFGGGFYRERPYFVMALLSGKNLREWLQLRGSFSVEDTLFVAMQICSALIAVHASGAVHRDLKPENIFVTYSGLAKLLDLGGAKFTRGIHSPITKKHENIGTAAYMAPEQFEGDADFRADLYALGIILYELLAGLHPHVRRNHGWPSDLELMRSHQQKEPRPLTEVLVAFPDSLWQIIAWCLRKSPHDRPASARVLLEALGREFDRLNQQFGPAIAPGAAFLQHEPRTPPGQALSLTDDPRLHAAPPGEMDSTHTPVERNSPSLTPSAGGTFDTPSSLSFVPEIHRAPRVRRWSLMAFGGLIGILGTAYALRPSRPLANPPAPTSMVADTQSAPAPPPPVPRELTTASAPIAPSVPSAPVTESPRVAPIDPANMTSSPEPPAALPHPAPTHVERLVSKPPRPALSARLLTPTFSTVPNATDDTRRKPSAPVDPYAP